MLFSSPLEWRYAVKQFDDSKILTDEQLFCIDESLRLSPSSFGLQPWKFIRIQNKGIRESLLPHSWNQSQIIDASHVYVLCARTDVTAEMIAEYVDSVALTRSVDRESLSGYESMMQSALLSRDEHAKNSWARNQVYIAMGVMLAECARLQIDACPMEGFDPKAYTDILDLESKHLSPVLVCPVGYRHADDVYATRKKVRFAREDVFIDV